MIPNRVRQIGGLEADETVLVSVIVPRDYGKRGFSRYVRIFKQSGREITITVVIKTGYKLGWVNGVRAVRIKGCGFDPADYVIQSLSKAVFGNEAVLKYLKL